MENIRVLHVIARMNVGGTARYVARLIEAAPSQGLTVALATGYVQGAEVEDPCMESIDAKRVKHLGRAISLPNDLRSYFELRKIIKDFQPDILHSHTFKAGVIARLQKGKFKKVHTFHGHLFDDQEFSGSKKIIITRLEKFLAKRTDLLISVGEKVGRELRAVGVGVKQEWVSIAPGVDPLAYHPKPIARQRLGVSMDGKYVGWMARVTGVKNPLRFLEVVKLLPNINFLMAGGGDLLELIKAQAPKNLTVLGWSDASLFWSAVDFGISTSDNEGMPIALIEAQLAGIPIVATDVGSTREVIADAETGFITSNDPREIAQALQVMITESSAKDFAKQAKVRALKEFSPTQMLAKHLAVYQGLKKSSRS
jgi:glycosyltransferase involved in cell wall biosynthesis